MSCGHLSREYTEFSCPRCGKSDMIRCYHCREISNAYKCSECSFEGP